MRTLKLLLILLLVPSLCFGAASRTYDDVNDFETYTNTIDVTTGDVSYGIWVRTTEDAGTDAIFGKKNDTGFAAGYLLYQGTTDLWACVVADGTDLSGTTSDSNSDKDAIWSFMLCTWNGSTEDLKYYRDGVNTTTNTPSGVVDSLTNALSLRVGTDGATNNDSNGRAAYAQAEPRVLNDYEIQEIMWKPCSIGLQFCGVLWGASTEQDLGTGQKAGTVGGSTGTSQDGPPVMIGVGGAI